MVYGYWIVSPCYWMKKGETVWVIQQGIRRKNWSLSNILLRFLLYLSENINFSYT